MHWLNLCCYSVNQAGRAGSHPCCLRLGKFGRCTKDTAWVQSLHHNHCQEGHHSTDQRDTSEQLDLLWKERFKKYFRSIENFAWIRNGILYVKMVKVYCYNKKKLFITTTHQLIVYREQDIPGLHQYWGGQVKQSCRLTPPGELLTVFSGHIRACSVPSGQ